LRGVGFGAGGCDSTYGGGSSSSSSSSSSLSLSSSSLLGVGVYAGGSGARGDDKGWQYGQHDEKRGLCCIAQQCQYERPRGRNKTIVWPLHTQRHGPQTSLEQQGCERGEGERSGMAQVLQYEVMVDVECVDSGVGNMMMMMMCCNEETARNGRHDRRVEVEEEDGMVTCDI